MKKKTSLQIKLILLIFCNMYFYKQSIDREKNDDFKYTNHFKLNDFKVSGIMKIIFRNLFYGQF